MTPILTCPNAASQGHFILEPITIFAGVYKNKFSLALCLIVQNIFYISTFTV